MGVLRSWSYLCWVRIFCYKSVLEVSTKRHGSIMIILFVPNSVSITPWIHDTNWTYTRRSGDVQNIFCTCSVRSVYVFCPGKVRKNFFFESFNSLLIFLELWEIIVTATQNPLSANPTKWPNTLKQFVGCSRRIFWVCLTILWGWRLNS